MKKILVFICIFTILIIPIAQVSAQIVYDQWMFENEFLSKYGEHISYGGYSYEELYYHSDSKDNIDWCLISASTRPVSPANYYVVLGDWVSLKGKSFPFYNKFAVYDVMNETFIDICDIEDFSKYEGLTEQLLIQDFLIPLGDADYDKDLSILDATFIQKVLADKCEFNSNDDLSGRNNINDSYDLKYITDIDRDGKRSIMDATAIQMKLAKK